MSRSTTLRKLHQANSMKILHLLLVTRRMPTVSLRRTKAKARLQFNQSVNPSIRQSVSALATQIVAAQITGIAHYETTASLWDEILGALGAVVSSLEQNRDAKLTPEALASALKSGLRRRWRRIQRPNVLGPIGFAGVEPLTDSAIRYAENMLAPSRPRHVAEGSIVFAEQLFGVDETLSENGIVTRFNDFQWPKLSSPGSVRDLLAALDE